jgi:uncharacterized sodium:solute symporter family permease YidK
MNFSNHVAFSMSVLSFINHLMSLLLGFVGLLYCCSGGIKRFGVRDPSKNTFYMSKWLVPVFSAAEDLSSLQEIA